MLQALRSFWQFREFLGRSEEGEMFKSLSMPDILLTTPLAPITYMQEYHFETPKSMSPAQVAPKSFPLANSYHLPFRQVISSICFKNFLHFLGPSQTSYYHMFLWYPGLYNATTIFYKNQLSLPRGCKIFKGGTMSTQLTVISPGPLQNLVPCLVRNLLYYSTRE